MAGDGSTTDGRGSVITGFERYEVTGSELADRILTGNGIDSLSGGNGNDTLDGAGYNDLVLGGGGDDRVAGGAGNDRLSGNTGADTLDGGAGDDQLYTSIDNDTLTGGAGADRFIFGTNEIGRITITDFDTGVDQLEISTMLLQFMPDIGPLDPARLSFGAPVGTLAQFVLRYDADTDQSLLNWAPSGVNSAGEYATAVFEGAVTLVASDIFVI